MSRRERIAWIALLAAALLLRLVDLGVRPPHHDEAIHAHFADILLTQGAYRYDPTYHGPLLFYVMAGVFAVLGETMTTARLYPALAGVALVALPLALRRRLGPRAAWWCGALLAISPSYLYYSRFARNDVPVAFFTAAALVLLLRVRRRGWRVLPWVGVAAALHAISKETFYVIVPLLVAAGGVLMVREGLQVSARRLWAWLGSHRLPLATAALWFIAITLAAYTFMFIHPLDFVFPLKAVRYWYQQHEIQRVGGPWFYHLPRLALYEFVILGAALARVAMRRSKLGRIETFCLAWGVVSIAAFAYLGEKVPWLAVHQVLPFVPLAGLQLAHTFSPAGRGWSRTLASAALVATGWSALAVSFLYPTITPADPHAELLVFVQTTPAEEALARRGLEVAAASGDRPVAAVWGEGSWPLSWQWRRINVWWGPPAPGVCPDIVVCDPAEALQERERLGAGYREDRIPLRAWWVERWKGVNPLRVLEWFVTRRAWSALGSTDIAVFESSAVPGATGGEVGGVP